MTCSTSAVAVCCSNAFLSQQPRIFHRNNRLRREVLQQCDLFVGEGTDFLAKRRDSAQQFAVFSQCNDHHCPSAA